MKSSLSSCENEPISGSAPGTVPETAPNSVSAVWASVRLSRSKSIPAGQAAVQAPQPTQRPAKWKARRIFQAKLAEGVAEVSIRTGRFLSATQTLQ